AVTTDVHADTAEVGRELRDLVEPKPVVERIGMNKHEGRPFARHLVVDFRTCRFAERHMRFPGCCPLGVSWAGNYCCAEPPCNSIALCRSAFGVAKAFRISS